MTVLSILWPIFAQRNVQELLADAYVGLDVQQRFDKGSDGGTMWGDLHVEGMDQVYEWLEVGPDDVFCDLGSGVGKAVFHAALQLEPPQLVFGLEIGEARHKIAAEAWQRLKESAAQRGVKLGIVELQHGDLREALNLQRCTKVFLCSAGYPKDTLAHLASIFEKPLSGRARRIFSLMTLPGWGPASRRGKPITEVFYGTIEASWGPVQAHVYEVAEREEL